MGWKLKRKKKCSFNLISILYFIPKKKRTNSIQTVVINDCKVIIINLHQIDEESITYLRVQVSLRLRKRFPRTLWQRRYTCITYLTVFSLRHQSNNFNTILWKLFKHTKSSDVALPKHVCFTKNSYIVLPKLWYHFNYSSN